MTQLTHNVHVQLLREPIYVATGGSHERVGAPAQVRHVLNPYLCPPDSEGDRIQRLSLQTIAIARTASMAPVSVAAVHYMDEPLALPDGFESRPALRRSVLDLATFEVPRRLPLLFDVLDCGVEGAAPDSYVIFTNMDIALLPSFYASVQRLIGLGFESLLINRRTIYKYGFDPSLLPLMFADIGEPHDGFDCFVFPVRLLRNFVKAPVCIGAPDVARALLFNLVALSGRVLILRDAHLTFHLGDDKGWARPEFADYHAHNRAASQSVIDRHCADPARRELLQTFCAVHHENYSVP